MAALTSAQLATLRTLTTTFQSVQALGIAARADAERANLKLEQLQGYWDAKVLAGEPLPDSLLQELVDATAVAATIGPLDSQYRSDTATARQAVIDFIASPTPDP